MIQRIQTLFLLGASGLLFSMFFSKFASNADIIITYAQYRPFLTFSVITFLISFVSIFLFKNRIMQMRMCIYNMLVLIGYQGWIIYQFFSLKSKMTFSITAVFPFIAIILSFLALRYIGRDEALVRSVNSLRKMAKKKKK